MTEIVKAASQGARLFSIKHEYPGEWSKFLHSIADSSPHAMNVNLSGDRFPFTPPGRTIKVHGVGLYFLLKGTAVEFHGPLLLQITMSSDSPVDLSLADKGLDGVLQDSFAVERSLPLAIGIALPRDSSLPGSLKLPDSAVSVPTLNPDAVEDLYVVCHYSS